MLLSLCLMMGLLPTTAFAADQPTKRDEYNVYSANVINGGADSRVSVSYTHLTLPTN